MHTSLIVHSRTKCSCHQVFQGVKITNNLWIPFGQHETTLGVGVESFVVTAMVVVTVDAPLCFDFDAVSSVCYHKCHAYQQNESDTLPDPEGLVCLQIVGAD